VSLNTMEPSDSASAQLAWLRADLARYPGTCTIAISHHPRYGTGPQWNTLRFEPVWAALSGHAAALLSGHVHNYQRHFPVRRVVQFVVGTGGRIRGNTDGRDPRLASSQDGVFGALRLRLGLGEARFEFIPISGPALDAGTLECEPHQPTPARVRVVRPRNRGVYRAIRTLRGRARNARRLRVKLVRRIERQGCRAWNGRAFEEASCKTRLSAPLRGRNSWKLRFRRRLRSGGYRLTIAARALDGTLARKTVRFRAR
jgi:hypothetical protein